MKKILALLLSSLLMFSSCVAFRDADDDPYDYIKESDSEMSSESSSESESESETESETVTETEPETEPVPFADTDISFVAVGDNLVHANIWLSAERRGTAEKKYDFLPMYEHIADTVKNADVAFINQETIMAGEKYGYTAWPTFNSPQQLGIDLVTLGFDVVNVASNHLLDKGESGYRDVLDFWHTQPVTMIGGYYNKEDHDNIRITEVDGVKIAWLSYTFSTNGISLPLGSEMYVPYFYDDLVNFTGIKEELIRSDIAKAESVADITIVSMHWSKQEYTHVPDADQKYLAQLMADCGVEVILGHHSHCLQPIEWVKGADGGETLCIYSLGNIASGQTGGLKLVGGIFSFNVVGDGEGGLKVVNPLLSPTVMYYEWDWMNAKIYPLDMYTDEIAAGHGMNNPEIYGAPMTPAEAESIVKGCIAEEFLPEYMK